MLRFSKFQISYRYLAAVLMLLGLNAFADKITDRVPMSARGLGMGYTGVNASDDAYSAFINPANLASKRVKPHLEVLNIQGDLDTGGFRSTSSGRMPTSLGNLYPWIKSNVGEWAGGRISVFPNFSSRLFSFGILYESDFAAKYDNANSQISNDSPKVTHKGYKRIIPNGTLSFRMFGGILKFGYNLGVEYLGTANSVVTNPDGKDLSFTNGLYEGVGIHHTAGLTLTMPMAHLPSFSFVARDIGNTKYFGGSLNTTQKMTFDGGFSHTTYISKGLEFKITGDYRDISNATKYNLMSRIFTGFEMKLLRKLHLRGGYSQGGMSAGLGFYSGRSKLDFAWYHKEMMDRYREDLDQRFVMQITWFLFNSQK